MSGVVRAQQSAGELHLWEVSAVTEKYRVDTLTLSLVGGIVLCLAGLAFPLAPSDIYTPLLSVVYLGLGLGVVSMFCMRVVEERACEVGGGSA